MFSDDFTKPLQLLHMTIPRSSSGLVKPNEPSEQKEVEISETDKLKNAVRQLYTEKQELKAELDRAVIAHKDEVHKLTEERNLLKLQYSEIIEQISKQPKQASRSQRLKLESLSNQLEELMVSIKTANLELNDLELNYQVFQQQADQYKIQAESLEEDSIQANEIKKQISVQKAQMTQLNDEIRSKSRKIRELEASLQWSSRELQKAKQLLDQSGAKSPDLFIELQLPVSIAPSLIHLNETAKHIYSQMNSIIDSPSDEDLVSFIKSLPNKVKSLKNENQSLLEHNTRFNHKIAKLKGKKKIVTSPNQMPPEKMAEGIKKLIISNKKKSSKLKKLRDIVTEQHTQLQQKKDDPSEKYQIAITLRDVIHKLALCNSSERAEIAQLANKYLDILVQ